MRRWLVRVALGAVGVAVLAVLALYGVVCASFPQVEGVIALPGLTAPVEVRRDAHAIPGISARTEADAYFAMGFLHGQDRLWQMEIDRLAGEGRLAELLGPEALPSDRFIRTLGLQSAAERATAGLDPATLALLESYAAGVNAAIARFGWLLPPEFLILRHRPAPWRPVDSVRLLKLMAFTLSGNWRQELLRARLARTLRPEQLALLWPAADAGPTTLAAAGLPLDALAGVLPPPPPDGIGSNVWVVAGSRTTSGRPLLANDPHLGLQLPGQWYLARIDAPPLAVTGATLPGAPFVVLGRNRDLAWGFTNTGSDTQDLFVERLDPADPSRYLVPGGGSVPFERHTEVIAVRGSPAEPFEIRSTRHGPVISDLVPGAAGMASADQVLALAWTQILDPGPDTTAAAGFALGRATTPEEFVAAAELYRGAQQNMAFATVSGRIGMISPGLVPIRRAGDGLGPVPGWTGAFDWTGFVPASVLPRTLDPPSGMLFNANNRLVGDSYPYFLGATWEEPFRAERIGALLAAEPRLDPAAAARIQLDQRTGLQDAFAAVLPPAASLPPEVRPSREALAAWDGRMDVDRPEPLLDAAWRRAFGRWLAGRALGPELVELGERPGFQYRALAACADGSCADAAARAYLDAFTELQASQGSDWQGWRWGSAHRAVLAHRPFEAVPWLRDLFSRDEPFGGDATTVNVAGPGPGREEVPFNVVHGAGYRAVYDLSEPAGARWIAATGQSGHPLSPHYDDLVESWRRGGYLPMDGGGPDATGGRLQLMPLGER